MAALDTSLVSIVVPVYKSTLDWNEKISWERCKQVFKGRHIILVYPEGMDISIYEDAAEKCIAFPPRYFKSLHAYSKLLCLPKFYQPFLSYKFMLIYQLDTFIFENTIEEWCAKNYAYVGAPWIDAAWINKLAAKIPIIKKLIYPVGNGGLSLRKVSKLYWSSIILLPLQLVWRKKWHEDFYWAFAGKRFIPFFRMPSVNEALQFSFEENPDRCYVSNNYQLPFGCHAWEKFNPEFWEPHFNKYGYYFPKDK